MLINGEKWACDSCVKGHRVSNCNHADRPLNHIAPKGRPVKQCEHCRDARKSKSHHAKCDCGSKRAKDKTKSEPKSEDHGCCCHKGTNCVCSNRAEMQALRLETSLNRATNLVKSKPKLTSSNSETTLTVFANGHHKPVHRNNNLAHTSGAPYKIPRPHTLHGASSFAQATREDGVDDMFGRSADDLLLLNSTSPAKLYGSLSNAHNSAESLHVPIAGREITSFDVEAVTANSTSPSESAGAGDLANAAGTGMNWFDTSLASVAEVPGGFSTSPTFGTMPDFDWNIPSATTDFFSPADLPLVSNPVFPDYAQPISNSGESSYQSAPGLTAPSSGTQSEIGETALPADTDAAGFWTDNVTFRDADPYRMSTASIYDNFSFPSPNGTDAKTQPSDPFSFNSTSVPQQHHAHHLSDSTAVPEESDDDAATSVNIGHLENLASLQASHNLQEKPFESEGELRSIIIPAGNDDNDSWYFPLNAEANNSDASREYSWLLDSA